VLDRVAKGAGGEIGFGAMTVIIEGEKKGLKLAGPLPPDAQNYTTYAATTLAGAAGDGARELLRYVALPPARALFAAAGID
jgi:hypothetical protein